MKEAFLFAFVWYVIMEVYADISTKLITWIVVRAASYLPRKHRSRWQEEWLGDLQTRHRLLRLFFALGLFKASLLIRREYITIASARRGWRPQFMSPADRVAKRAFDIFFALPTLVYLTPLLLMVAAVIRLVCRGPALSAELCRDTKGQPFSLYRFNIPMGHDGMPTRVGRLLHRTRLDLLPRLFNVLNGTLSIVGVRPTTLAEGGVRLQLLNTRTAATRPGLIYFGESIDCATCGMARDLDYVQQWSILLDLKLLLRGIHRFLRVPYVKPHDRGGDPPDEPWRY